MSGATTPGTAGSAQMLPSLAARHGTWRGWVRALLAESEYRLGRLDRWLMPRRPVERLVFVCLGNINRSAYAEAVARAQGADAISIGLATTTGAAANPMAVDEAQRHGIDLTAHRATDLGDYTWRAGDLLLAMEIRHVHRLIAHGLPSHAIVLLGRWSTPRCIHLHDPHTLSAAYFTTCFSRIDSAVRGLLLELRR